MPETNETERPDPDALLDVITRERKRRRLGRLHLFLGMAPGVGKTYAMLLAAQEALKEKVDIVVGVAETHGRVETQELLTGLIIIPKKKMEYRGISLEEMDIDAILERKPKLVLVDELAHSNVPGSRHSKRWQDVFEILDAGIDVYSTLNVQHLESRKETVEEIAGISVHETVPDTVLDRAHEIRLIDLSPSDLLKRLKEGKVYLGEKATLAASNFFKEQNLTALREISLRLAAERVDFDLQSMTASKEAGARWTVTERMMVAIDPSTHVEELIRTTRRLAYNLEAQWIAIHVNTGATLTPEERAALTKNLELARSLGAEVVTIANSDVVRALTRVARQKNVTQLVIGRPQGGRSKRSFERLIFDNPDIDVHVVKLGPDDRKRRFGWRQYFEWHAPFRSYLMSFGVVISLCILAQLLVPILGYRAVGFFLLLGVIGLGLMLSIGPLLMTAGLSALAWSYLFIPPVGSLKIREPADFFMVVSYFVSAMAIGILTQRVRKQEDILRSREDRSRILYEVIWDIATTVGRKETLNAVCDRVGAFLGGLCDVSLKRADHTLKPLDEKRLKFAKPERELGIAKWVYDNGKHAGWSTDTLAAAEALYIPLKGTQDTVGVLAFKPTRKVSLVPEDLDLLFTICRQLAISLEREIFKDRALETQRLKETEKLQRNILQFISDELKKPLALIVQSAAILAERDDQLDKLAREALSHQVLDDTEKLNLIMDDLFAMSRLATGIFPLNKEKCDPVKLFQLARDKVRRSLDHREIKVTAEDHLPALQVEVTLCKQALADVLLNAATYHADQATLHIEIKEENQEIHFTIKDSGPGIPEEVLTRIFDKFYRLPAYRGEGAGMGLAVARGVVKAHGGKVIVANNPTGGASFTVSLPIG